MKLQIDRWYKTRGGALIGPLSSTPSDDAASAAYPFCFRVGDAVVHSWRENGNYGYLGKHPMDLVEPADSPAAEQAVTDKSFVLYPTTEIGTPVRVESTNPKDRLGAKKPPIMLIPPVALVHEAMAFKNGAYTKGYGPFNWREKRVSAMTYIGAILRHVLQYLDGETHAKDSGVHHMGHLRASAAILLDAEVQGNLVDDRPTPGKCAELIELLTETFEEADRPVAR
jgi:hypothetical protein